MAFNSPVEVVISNNAGATASGVTLTLTPPATGPDGYGAMRTEVHVHPAAALAPQDHPNQLFGF